MTSIRAVQYTIWWKNASWIKSHNFLLTCYTPISFALLLWLWNKNSYFHPLRKSLWVLSKSLLPSSLNNFLLSSCTLNTWWESYFLSYPSVTHKYWICAPPWKSVHFIQQNAASVWCRWINQGLWIYKRHWRFQSVLYGNHSQENLYLQRKML